MKLRSAVKRRPRRTRTYILPLERWFPSDDQFAAILARLCILREDLFLEVQGIVKDPIKHLDANSAKWRHGYFFRNSVKTLNEIASAIQVLRSNQEFKRALSREPDARQKFFHRFSKDIEQAQELLKHVRNSLGGHIKQSAVERALKSVDYGLNGKLERGTNYQDTHYCFVYELSMVILKAGDPEKGYPETDIDGILKKTETIAKLIKALIVIDLIFDLYARRQHLY